MILIDGYPYDTSTSESHERTSETTRFPVESGSDLSDHVRTNNNIVSLSIIVSDTPIGEVELLRDLEGEGQSIKPSDEAKARLVRLRDEKKTTTIVTAGGVYENVVLTSFIEKKGPEFTGGLFADLTFEQRRVIVSERAVVKVAAPRIAKKIDKGPQSTRPAHIVDRKVNCDNKRSGGCAWFDPDIQAWRLSAWFDQKTGHWKFLKGPLEDDGFMGTDEAIRKHLRDEAFNNPSSPFFHPGPMVVKSMDGTTTNVIPTPGQTVILEPSAADWAAVDAGQPLPLPAPNLPPESLRP